MRRSVKTSASVGGGPRRHDALWRATGMVRLYARTASSLRLEGPKGILEIDGMSLDLRGKELLRTLYEGDSRMEIKRWSTTAIDKDQQFTVNDLLLGQVKITLRIAS